MTDTFTTRATVVGGSPATGRAVGQPSGAHPPAGCHPRPFDRRRASYERFQPAFGSRTIAAPRRSISELPTGRRLVVERSRLHSRPPTFGNPHGGGPAGRDRRGHEPLSERRAPGQLGRNVSGTQRERRQAEERPDAGGQYLVAKCPDRSGARREPQVRTATAKPSTATWSHDGARRGRSSPWGIDSWLLPTISSLATSHIATSEAATSTNSTERQWNTASSAALIDLGTRLRSSRSPKQPDYHRRHPARHLVTQAADPFRSR